MSDHTFKPTPKPRVRRRVFKPQNSTDNSDVAPSLSKNVEDPLAETNGSTSNEHFPEMTVVETSAVETVNNQSDKVHNHEYQSMAPNQFNRMPEYYNMDTPLSQTETEHQLASLELSSSSQLPTKSHHVCANVSPPRPRLRKRRQFKRDASQDDQPFPSEHSFKRISKTLVPEAVHDQHDHATSDQKDSHVSIRQSSDSDSDYENTFQSRFYDYADNRGDEVRFSENEATLVSDSHSTAQHEKGEISSSNQSDSRNGNVKEKILRSKSQPIRPPPPKLKSIVRENFPRNPFFTFLSALNVYRFSASRYAVNSFVKSKMKILLSLSFVTSS